MDTVALTLLRSSDKRKPDIAIQHRKMSFYILHAYDLTNESCIRFDRQSLRVIFFFSTSTIAHVKSVGSIATGSHPMPRRVINIRVNTKTAIVSHRFIFLVTAVFRSK